MSHRRFVPSLALASYGAGFLLACASAPGVPASSVQPTAPAIASSAPAVASATSAASAPAAPEPVASAPSAPPPSAAPPPPCIDGEILMGACICSKGKSADATGHCVFMATCPQVKGGGTVFRDEKTGQCRQCRPGTTPTPDGHCAP